MTALRAFESAARLRSFKRAAAELHVTPTAVSHQIRLLEHDLGVSLFARLPRRVELTAQGRQLQDRLSGAFLDIADALAALRTAPMPGVVTVTTTDSFAALWLVPRLHRFRAAHPEVQVRVEGRPEVVDLRVERSIDVAIRYGGGPVPGLVSPWVLEERFGVYGTPSVVAAAAKKAPALISVAWQDSTLYEDGWREWCERAGVDWLRRKVPLLEYKEEHYALQAAIAGEGLVLASSVMVTGSVRAGLLKPFRDDVCVDGSRYRALCLPGRERQVQVKEFLEWLEAESGRIGGA
ncbi:LysR substrate-binding domain-containing protein [Dokdonella sp.]|uniref:LysR substrate-binding domain-containing protein n=1 Tax=Dokdonella sp. TaxID=2291710 RepID=UPI001B1FD2C9|nr:LysR substrate-binding domain-containing protein [Dokdonella sp.]MBO9664393.1 LysR family transcriptional regulator [Dokdonella sp.]